MKYDLFQVERVETRGDIQLNDDVTDLVMDFFLKVVWKYFGEGIPHDYVRFCHCLVNFNGFCLTGLISITILKQTSYGCHVHTCCL